MRAAKDPPARTASRPSRTKTGFPTTNLALKSGEDVTWRRQLRAYRASARAKQRKK